VIGITYKDAEGCLGKLTAEGMGLGFEMRRKIYRKGAETLRNAGEIDNV
jgi:hypothetical protein